MIPRNRNGGLWDEGTLLLRDLFHPVKHGADDRTWGLRVQLHNLDEHTKNGGSLLDPFVGRRTKLLHREDHRLTCIGWKQTDDVLMNCDVHESKLVAGLSSFRGQLYFNNPAVLPSNALLYDSLGDESINDPRETAAGQAQASGQLTRSHLLGVPD